MLEKALSVRKLFSLNKFIVIDNQCQITLYVQIMLHSAYRFCNSAFLFCRDSVARLRLQKYFLLSSGRVLPVAHRMYRVALEVPVKDLRKGLSR